MKIPKQLKIGGHIYKIILEARSKERGVSSVGTCDWKYGKIWIDNSWIKSQIEATLIHEIIEAINFNSEIGLEHKQIQALENGLYQVLKDNNLLK